MTTTLAAALLALTLLDAEPSVGPLREAGRDGLVVSRLPYQQQQSYKVFESKCGRCHDLARALDADFSAERWRQYLKRKDRRSGASISQRQSEEINQFLGWWSVQRTRR
jgi:hypothetical protein